MTDPTTDAPPDTPDTPAPPDTPATPGHPPDAPPRGLLAALDAWMAQSPWNARITPFMVYLLFLSLITAATSWGHVATYAPLYALQCALVAWLLWRYRKLVPELTVSFHWLAVPTGVGLFVAWVALGEWMAGLSPRFDYTSPQTAAALGMEHAGAVTDPHLFEQMHDASPALYYASLGLRLLGMTLLVPLFEELFVRSACLRGLHSARKTGIGLCQFLEDVPLIGDWFIETKLSQRASKYPPMFTQQLEEWPVGALTVFGVFASTMIFMLSHAMRDWPGTIACGVVWCLLLWYTNRAGATRKLGLGPIVWSHGITNACLWAWVLYSGQWHYL